MPNYLHKDRAELAYDANKKRLRTEGAIILAELMNEALNEMTKEFNTAQAKGEILDIGGTREEMQNYLAIAAQKQLPAPKADVEVEAEGWGDEE